VLVRLELLAIVTITHFHVWAPRIDTPSARSLDPEASPRSAFLAPGEQRVRTFDSFTQPFAELVDARVWAGLHFRHGDVEGQFLGLDVANYGVTNYFQSVGH
jgi:hypothetical protein